MKFNSKIVTSNQNDIHSNLIKIIDKHINHPYRKPIADHTKIAFETVHQKIQSKQFILDTGCGTGLSSYHLAVNFPDKIIIGIDRSHARLEKYSCPKPSNLILIRADIVDFFLLLKQYELEPFAQYFLYPNPYPKSSQVKFRWYAHPIFTTILELGGKFEFRTNWKLYLDELKVAMKYIKNIDISVQEFIPQNHLTLFEKKYSLSDQKLYKSQFLLI